MPRNWLLVMPKGTREGMHGRTPRPPFNSWKQGDETSLIARSDPRVMRHMPQLSLRRPWDSEYRRLVDFCGTLQSKRKENNQSVRPVSRLSSSCPATTACAIVVSTGPPFFQRAILQLSYKVCLASSISWSSAHASSSTNVADVACLLVGRGIVGRAGLQTDRCVGIKVRYYSLQRGWDAVCHIHGRGTLATSSCSSLCIERRLRLIELVRMLLRLVAVHGSGRWRLLQHWRLVICVWNSGRRVWWRSLLLLLCGSVHVGIHG
jgi:hypothetical protein